MQRPPDIDILRAYLHDRDVACPGCGYSLRSCQSNVCPECGLPIRLVLREAPRRGIRAHAHWLFSVSVLAWVAITSCATVILLGLALMLASRRGAAIFEAKLRLAVAGLLTVASVAGLVSAIRSWRTCTPQRAATLFRLARLVAVSYVLLQCVGWIAWRMLV